MLQFDKDNRKQTVYKDITTIKLIVYRDEIGIKQKRSSEEDL